MTHICGCGSYAPCPKALILFDSGQNSELRRHLRRTWITMERAAAPKAAHRPTGRIRLVDDAGWEAESQPLLEFLRTPRTWPELEAWAGAIRLEDHRLRNQLCWLEGARRAESERRKDDRQIVWRQSRVVEFPAERRTG